MNKKNLPILGILLLSSSGIFAQELGSGQFDVKVATQKINCASGKLSVDVQVKAHDEKSVFFMGDANYRLHYNPSIIRNPSIQKQVNFTNVGDVNSPNYGAHNLNGSVARMNEGIVSLNTFYAGTGNAQKVDSKEFMTISTLEFDIADLKKTVEIKWQEGEGKSFPCTGMNEVHAKKDASGNLDYDLKITKSEGTFSSLTINLADACKVSASSPIQGADSFFIPEGFSPDGDGANDKFVIKNPDGLALGIEVFDRNGTVVYKNEEYKNDWDGKANQEGFSQERPVKPGTYYYVVKRGDGKTFTRFMTILH
jgi:gliding motility-associated-like protein